MSAPSLRRLIALDFFLYAVDMGCAFGGFVYGFGMSVHSWPAVIGFMVLSRWAFYTTHRLVRHARDKAEGAS